MRILLIKMSSMGDVFHTFPALSDAQKNIKDIEFDWIVEEAFAEIPHWHPTVKNIFPIALRRWRKAPFNKHNINEKKEFFKKLQKEEYDLIIDAQGLIKSALVGKKFSISKAGMDWSSAREPLASLFYQKKYSIPKDLHAIQRLRILFSKALNYELSSKEPIRYNLTKDKFKETAFLKEKNYLVFLHGTTWKTKYWPEEYWKEVLDKASKENLMVVLPWGNQLEKERAIRITAGYQNTWVPKNKLSLNEIASLLSHATGVISVDTGLSHVAAALDIPMTVIYRVTDPKSVGALGIKVKHITSPCAQDYIKNFKDKNQEIKSLQNISPTDVWNKLNNNFS